MGVKRGLLLKKNAYYKCLKSKRPGKYLHLRRIKQVIIQYIK
jgi:hypothetical protein